MSPLRLIPIVLLLLCPIDLAWADVWKCTNGDGGVSYTNAKPANPKACKLLSQDQPISTTPAVKPKPNASPANFPKVDSGTQKGRDLTRRQILENELSAEREQLEKARATLTEQESLRNGEERNYERVLERLKPYQEKVAEHQRNVDALTEEMGKLK